MRSIIRYPLIIFLAIAPIALLNAQTPVRDAYLLNRGIAYSLPDVTLPSTVPLPWMTPELALQLFTQRSVERAQNVAAYTDTTIVHAELPDSSQKGEYELIRSFIPPKSLSFATVKFTGDNFVKTNVIVRLLQQEVEHVEKGDTASTALTEQNYKFAYKGVETIEGAACHVFNLKPRRKVPGLFKGKIYVDARSGNLRRAEGTMVKSPSFWVKKIEFVQNFDDFEGITLPTTMHSTAKARIIGRTIVNVTHRDYRLAPLGDYRLTVVSQSPVDSRLTR